MNNRNVDIAKDYHQATKLSYINLSNKPPLYKSYPGLPEVPLPTEFPRPEVATLEALAVEAVTEDSVSRAVSTRAVSTGKPLDLVQVAQMLYFSAGLLHRRVLPVAGEVHYRAAASAGALYPVEAYLVAGDVEGLAPGVYHFSPSDFNLKQLRAGDYRNNLAEAAAGDSDIASSPATLVFTAIFWRSAWKYRVRSYRYCLWDLGTILANFLATVRGEAGLPTSLVTGFVDRQVNDLLGLDAQREGSLCLVPVGVGQKGTGGAASSSTLGLIAAGIEPQADEISYPEIIQAHAGSSLITQEEAREWKEAAAQPLPHIRNAAQGQSGQALRPTSQGLASDALGATITQRGSTRRFARANITGAQFSAILDSSTRQVPADFLSPYQASLLEVYTIVNAVDGLSSGSYYFSPVQRRLELLQEGEFRQEAGHLCFEQALGADCSAVLYFLADLGRITEHLGNRGYRAAQLEAGIMVGNAYLSAHSLGLGATGTTFYDDDVTEFFSPHAAGKSMMFLVALGRIDDNNRVRPFRSRVGVLLDSLARGAGQTPR